MASSLQPSLGPTFSFFVLARGANEMPEQKYLVITSKKKLNLTKVVKKAKNGAPVLKNRSRAGHDLGST